VSASGSSGYLCVGIQYLIASNTNQGYAVFRLDQIYGRVSPERVCRSADEKRWGMSRAELEKRILRLYKGGTGLVKIGKTLGIGTALVQRVVTDLPRPFDVGVVEPYAVQ
jgi:hypothetical protein